MTTKELYRAMMLRGYTNLEARLAVNHLMDIFKEAIEDGDSIHFKGIGKIYPIKKRSRRLNGLVDPKRPTDRRIYLMGERVVYGFKLTETFLAKCQPSWFALFSIKRTEKIIGKKNG